jgi:hypothetical protein
MSFEEIDRGELPCYCPCGRTWLISRGRIDYGGEVTSFVVVPTIHDEPVCWFALGRGAQPTEWVFTRAWMDGDNIASAIVDAGGSPIGDTKAFHALGGSVLSREQVVGDDARKRQIFAVQDAIMRAHEDIQQLFDPERGRDFSFKMPDCVFAQDAGARSPRNSENFAECGDRLFVRALLPVKIGDGGELRVGVWVEVPEDQFMALVEVFWDDEEAYVAMSLDGPVENSMRLLGHDVQRAKVTLAARTADKCLFVRESTEPWLASLMAEGVPVNALPELIREIELSVGRATN